MNVLIVYDWYSICTACGRNADPSEEYHLMEKMGYESGCGERFDALSAGGNYGEDFAEAVQQLRPDLPMVEYLR